MENVHETTAQIYKMSYFEILSVQQIDWGDIGLTGDTNNGDIDFGDDINFDMSEITLETGGTDGEDNQVSSVDRITGNW